MLNFFIFCIFSLLFLMLVLKIGGSDLIMDIDQLLGVMGCRDVGFHARIAQYVAGALMGEIFFHEYLIHFLSYQPLGHPNAFCSFNGPVRVLNDLLFLHPTVFKTNVGQQKIG